MTGVRALVLRGPGTNCDVETCYALERVGARPMRVHVNALLAEPRQLDDYQVLVIPGGFSYGDDVAAGKILANQLRLRLAERLLQFRDSGRVILGICNGFQVLAKAGLLPGWDDAAGQQAVTLAYNDSGRFEDRWIHLQADPGRCIFLRGVDRLELPIAHGEGKFVWRDESVIDRLRSGGQIVLYYVAPAATGACPAPAGTPAGTAAAAGRATGVNTYQQITTLPYPLNPNGSWANIAGICDATGRVFGLMPHPERHAEPTQHPQWTRRGRAPEGDGLRVFRNAVEYFR